MVTGKTGRGAKSIRMAHGVMAASPLRAYQFTILAHLLVLPFFHSYQFPALSVLAFYHFSALVGFTIFTMRANFRLCRF